MQKDSSTFPFRIIRLSPDNITALADVAEIEKEAFSSDAQTLGNLALLARIGAIWVATAENCAIVAEAIVLGNLERTEAFLFSLAVNSNIRRAGAATALMSTIIDDLRKRKIRCLSLTCDPQNEAALRLYLEKFEFSKAESLPDHFGPGRHRLLLTKHLF